MKGKTSLVLMVAAVIVVVLFIGLALNQAVPPALEYPTTTRQEVIPEDAVKILPDDDLYPPVLHMDLWYDPVPLEGPINTAGAEDSPFITPDGGTMYFFFTPDPNVVVQGQLFDNVTGIWRSDWNGSAWSEPQRVWLQEPDKLALDGAAFVQGDTMWFASAREGYTGVNLFTARLVDGRWKDWTYAGDQFNQDYMVGEMHISQNGTELYFHSLRGGQGGLDLWVTKYEDGQWQEPESLEVLNTQENDGWPFLSEDGNELWFTRGYMGSPSVWRSLKVDGAWTSPELVVSSFAGEPTLDLDGNLYFVHHFFEDGVMLEADIYVAYRK